MKAVTDKLKKGIPNILKKRTPNINNIVASKIDSGEKDNSVTLRSYTGSPSAPKGNQSTVSPAGSSSEPQLKSTKPSKLRGKVTAAQTMTIEDIQSGLKKAIEKKLPYNVIYLIRTNRETINKEINSGNNKIIDLVDKAANVKATSKGKTAYEIAEDKDNKEFLEVVDNACKKKKSSSVTQEATEHLPKKRQIIPQSVAPQVTKLNRSDSGTLNDLTIEEIQQKLEDAIKDKEISSIINLISDNHETINKEISSDNTEVMELILQAAHDVKDAGIEKTAYEMAKEQNNLILQEVVKNASDKLVELRKKDENFLTLTYGIDSYGTSIGYANTNPQSQHTILQSAAPRDYENMKRWTTSPNLTNGKKSELNNSLSQSAPSVTHKSCENFEEACSEFDRNFYLTNLQNAIRDKKVDRIISIITENIDLIHSILNSDDQVIKQLHIDNLYKAIKITDLDLCKNLSEQSVKVLELFNSLKNIMPSALEATDEEGETLQDIAKTIGCKGTELHSLGGKDSQSSEDEDALNSLLESGNPEKKPLNLPLSPVRPSLPDSDRDSGIDSPGSSPKKEGMESPQSSRRNGISSNTGSDTEEEETNPELPIPAPRPSKRKQPEPVVTPARDAAKAPDRVTKEPKVIISEEKKKKENILPVKQKPAISGNSDKNIPLKKQSNDRNFYIALTAISTAGAIACFAVAGIYSMSVKKTELATSSIAVIGVLFAIGIGFATTAVITWCLTPPPPSSELLRTGLTHQAAEREGVS